MVPPRDPNEAHALLTRHREDLLAQGDIDVRPTDKEMATEKVDDDASPLSEMQQVIASRRNKERTATLRAIDRALARLHEDPEMYGHCVQCEEPIADRRLALLPWAERCIRCQEGGEAASGRPGPRRHLTDYE